MKRSSPIATRCTPVLLACLVALAVPASARGDDPLQVLLASTDVPAACKPVDGTFPVDLQTAILWDYSAYEGLLPQPRTKQHQSFECEGQKGTLFYFAYASEAERRRVSSFARGVLWGEGKPTPMHPELVFDRGRFLVVVSFRKAPPALVTAVERKLAASR